VDAIDRCLVADIRDSARIRGETFALMNEED